MSIPGLNNIRRAIQQTAKGIVALDAALEEYDWSHIEDHAGMSGERPIAAIQLAEPSFDAELAEREAEHQAEAETEAKPDPVSLEQVRAVLATLSQAGHTTKVRELIQATGVNKLSEVDPEKYAWLLAQAEGLTDA